MNATPPPSPRRQSRPNLPMTATAFRKEVSALRAALRRRFGSSLHHADYAQRSSPDNRPDAHNLLREVQDPAYHDQCDLFDHVSLDCLKSEDMHGIVILDLYVYVREGFGDYELYDNAYAYFVDGVFKGLSHYGSEAPARMLASLTGAAA